MSVNVSRMAWTPRTRDPHERYDGWTPPRYEVRGESLYVVRERDLLRIDNVAWHSYREPRLWWLIADYNGVVDPWSLRPGDRLRIPLVDMLDPVRLSPLGETSWPLPPRPSPPPPYSSPAVTETLLLASTVYVFGFPMPRCLTGNVTFEVQFSPDTAFNTVVLGSLSSMDIGRWFYFDPFDGQGVHKAYPPAGIDGGLYVGQPVYFQIRESDGLLKNVPYYVRFRPYARHGNVVTPGAWSSSPPITLT